MFSDGKKGNVISCKRLKTMNLLSEGPILGQQA